MALRVQVDILKETHFCPKEDYLRKKWHEADAPTQEAIIILLWLLNADNMFDLLHSKFVFLYTFELLL